DGVATKVHCLFRCDVDQLRNVFANGVLSVFVERSRKPNGRAVGQRTKTSVEMVKAWIDKFHRDNKTSEHLGDGAMRFNVGAEFVTAKKCVASAPRARLIQGLISYSMP